MTTATQTASKSTGKKDIQKLQRAIADGLEDVKAQDIVVFDTEHLSALFERVIIATGASNRQTKALAASVVDAVRAAGFAKPRVEGEANGEWIIVDCTQAVVHVMQPSIRHYYNLEELWGGKPVRLKLGAAKPVTGKVQTALKTDKALPTSRASVSLRRSSAARQGLEAAFPSKAQLKKTAENSLSAAKKVAAKAPPSSAARVKTSDVVAKPKVRTLVVNAPKKNSATQKVASRKVVAKKVVPRKA